MYEQLDADRAAGIDGTSARAAHNLPAPLTAFVGRDAERAQVIAQLRDPACRLVTIAGAGGVGKTRLALQAAHALLAAGADRGPFAHGVCFVPLAALMVREPLDDLLATTIASTLRLALSGPDTPATQVLQYLREKSLLLMLDGLEHILAGKMFIASLLQEAPGLKIVVTSRERLNIRGERVVALDGLAFPGSEQAAPPAEVERYGAVDLFVRTARALAPDFALSASTAPAVVRICQLVEGLPLGIELAAPWTRVLSCDEIAHEIEQNLDFLTNASPDLPTRQQSMRAVFDHSWSLLTASEQQAMRQLAVFHGSFTREAATAVLSFEFKVLSSEDKNSKLRTQNSELLAVLAALVDKSLVRRVAGASGGAARYEVLDLLRQYAAEQLERAGEVDAASARHADYYLAWIERWTADLRGPGQLDALAAIGLEIEQIRAAWRYATAHADSHALGRAAESLFHFYDMRSWFREGAAAFGAASLALVDAREDEARRVQGMLLARQGWFTFHLGRQPEGKALLERSLALLRELDDRDKMVFSLNYLGMVCFYLGEYDATRALCQAGLDLAQASGDIYGQVIAYNNLGQMAYECGEYTAAKEWCEQSLAIEQRTSNRWSMAYSLTTLGKVAYVTGAYEQARQLFEQSLHTREAVGDARGVAICFNRLGDTAVALGERAEAGERYAQSLALFREIGNQWGCASSLINLGQLAAGQGRDAAATRLFGEALRLALETKSVPQVVAIMGAYVGLLQSDGAPAWAAELAQFVAGKPETLAACQPYVDRLLAWRGPGSAAAQAMTLEQAVAEAKMPPALRARETPAAIPAAASPPKAFSNLTARELDVLRLVAQGLTDAQVAEKLVLSPRTVSTHLTSIYGKLQVTSRSAATRFAVEQGLV